MREKSVGPARDVRRVNVAGSRCEPNSRLGSEGDSMARVRFASAVMLMLAAALGMPSLIAAQTSGPAPDVFTLSLEDLLKTDVVSAASKFPQATTDAPASISIVTAS